MELNSESINTWKNGVERALKKYLPNGMEAKKGRNVRTVGWRP